MSSSPPEVREFGCCLALLPLVCAILLFCKFHTHAESLTVLDHNWSRKIFVEQFKTCREENTSVPPGGRQLRSWVYVAGYAHVGKINVPIYGTKYEYDIDRWVESYYLHATGQGVAPTWPDASKLKTGDTVGSERTGRREESYWLALHGPSADITYEMEEAAWRRISDRERLVGHFNDFGTLRWVDRAEED